LLQRSAPGLWVMSSIEALGHNPMRLRAVNVLRFPVYSSLDRLTGRCRISGKSLKSLFPKGIKTGSVLKLKLDQVHTSTLIIYCSLWPDTQQALSEDSMCLDIACVASGKRSSDVNVETLLDWTHAVVEVSNLKYVVYLIS
jgi:hypothetical protein